VGLLVSARPDAQAVRALPASDSGAVKLVDSRGGGAILSAWGMEPGESASGSVTLRNVGDEPAALVLSQSDLQERPGRGGGLLSKVLIVRIDDTTVGRRMYEGPMSRVTPVRLGVLPAGAGHDFRFTVTMARVNGAAYQDALSTVRYDWTGTEVTGGGSGSGTTTPPPVIDTQPPVLKLSGKRRQAAKRLAVTAVCNEPCTFAAHTELRQPKGMKRPQTVVKPPEGTRATLRVRFTPRTLKRLRRGVAVITVTARDAAGNSSSAVRRVRLVRKERRRPEVRGPFGPDAATGR
jgi:hypothetical protein